MLEIIKDEKAEKLIEGIIKIEWEMFQKVEGIGGRANCQDEWPTFNVMRTSQYAGWTDEMIKSYINDLALAVKEGRNLITEKYAYMMESSAKDYYKSKLEPYLPKVDLESCEIIEEIIDYLIECEKEFAKKYPKIGGQGRSIDSSSDSSSSTSVETYTRGELKTYSKNTLRLYLEHIRSCKAKGENIVMLVKDTTIKMYGYESLESAELGVK